MKSTCLYEKTGSTFNLKIFTHDKEESASSHEDTGEVETPVLPESEEKQYGSLAVEIKCKLNPQDKCIFVNGTKSYNTQKGWAKVAYLKLALWCKHNGYHYIGGFMQNPQAVPVLIRFKIPNSKTYVCIHPVYDSVSYNMALKLGVKFKDKMFHDSDSEAHGMIPIFEADGVPRETLLKLVPFYVETVLQ
jgi:hypothetical protein